jgi:hypothetical protein
MKENIDEKGIERKKQCKNKSFLLLIIYRFFFWAFLFYFCEYEFSTSHTGTLALAVCDSGIALTLRAT